MLCNFERWCFLVTFVLFLSGCATVQTRWSDSVSQNTIASYEEFIKRYPNSEFAEEARTKLETLYLRKARATDGADGHALFLARFPDSRHAADVRNRLKQIRCSDSTLMRTFPAWLKQGAETDPQQGARWTLGKTYVGAGESAIGAGYKVIADDPASPITVEYGAGYLKYLGGKGILIGKDHSKVLVGYSCE